MKRMSLRGFFLVFFGCLAPLLSAICRDVDLERKSFATSELIQRADLYFLREGQEPKAWLILCPGRNGSGEGLLRDAKWQAFARSHQLWMCGVSFMSNRKDDLLGEYTIVSKGTGCVILGECDQMAGRALPLYIVGFSAGARFTTNFVRWKPERVAAWSAQAVGHWPEPLDDGRVQPPGIVASGEYDAGSWFASLQYFQAARDRGHLTTWISLGRTGHQRSPELDEFAREFFEWKLSGAPPAHAWRDIDSKRTMNEEDVGKNAIFTSWFPSEKLALRWEAMHHP